MTNRRLLSHAYTATGDFDVVLRAYNDDGMAETTFTVRVLGGYTNYVSLDGSHLHPFTNWATAATNIQDAIDAASSGDTVLRCARWTSAAMCAS